MSIPKARYATSTSRTRWSAGSAMTSAACTPRSSPAARSKSAIRSKRKSQGCCDAAPVLSPSLRANGSRDARPMTGSAKQSMLRHMDCFVAYAPLRKRFAFVAGNDERSARRHHIGVDPAARDRRLPDAVAVVTRDHDRIAGCVDAADHADMPAAAPAHDRNGADLRSGHTLTVVGKRTRQIRV